MWLQRLGHGVHLAGDVLVPVVAAFLERQILLNGECLLTLRRRAVPGSALRDSPAVAQRVCQPGEQLSLFRLVESSDETVISLYVFMRSAPSRVDVARSVRFEGESWNMKRWEIFAVILCLYALRGHSRHTCRMTPTST